MATRDYLRVEPAVLTSWKEIAQHLGKGVRTVQRWEQHLGLPVLRPLGAGHKSTVLARRDELDAWMDSSWGRRAHAQSVRPEVTTSVGGLAVTMRESKALRNQNTQLMHEISQRVCDLVSQCRALQEMKILGVLPANPAEMHDPASSLALPEDVDDRLRENAGA